MTHLLRTLAITAFTAVSVALGGCVFETKDNIFPTDSGDVLPLNGKLMCQNYGNNGRPEDAPGFVHLILLKNGTARQYLWIGSPLLEGTKEGTPFVAYRVVDDTFLFVQSKGVNEPGQRTGQMIFVVQVTATQLGLRNYETARVVEIARKYPMIRINEGKFNWKSMSGHKFAQRQFLFNLAASTEGSRVVMKCERAPGNESDPK
ncbi:MAG: hypothetical protein Q8R25_03795 [bacterium]|nr:hypothetical protein [bacterium]